MNTGYKRVRLTLIYVILIGLAVNLGFCLNSKRPEALAKVYQGEIDFVLGFSDKWLFSNHKIDSEEKATVAKEKTAEPDRWLAWDKFWHFTASFVTVGAGYHLCANRVNLNDTLATYISLGGTIGLGASKELLDRYWFHRRFSWKDIVANTLGIAVGYFVFIH